MMTIQVDASRFKNLAKTLIKQVEWATVTALTDTAEDLAKVEEVLMRQTIDRPTPFTQRGIRHERATRSSMQSAVYVAPQQAKYLRYQIDGGSQSYRKPAPVHGSMDGYGNLPKGYLGKTRGIYRVNSGGKVLYFLRAAKGGSTPLMMASAGKGGRRKAGKSSKLVAVLTNHRSYGRIFPFYERAMSRVPTYFKRVYGRHLRAALASAK